MHVALYTPAWPLECFQNGIVTFVHWMRYELEQLGHRVSVFTPQLDSSIRDPRVHVVAATRWERGVQRLAGRLNVGEDPIWGFGRLIAEAVLRVHRDDPIDVIEMEESFGWTAAVEQITSIPLLVKLHGPAFLSLTDEERRTPLGAERIVREGRALKAARAIAAPSVDTLNRTLVYHRLNPAIVEHVVNPIVEVDLPVWDLAGSVPDTVLFVGRFDRRKGADVLLEAFATLLQHRPWLRLIMVGPDSGLLQDDGTRIHFEAYRDALLPEPLRARIEFRGRMANREIASLRTHARAVVVASRWENQGYTVIEALLQGCPVVASDVGGNPESVIDGQTGLLAHVEAPADLARQLARLLDEPERAERMGAEARRQVSAAHSARVVAEQSLALYQRVIQHVAEKTQS